MKIISGSSNQQFAKSLGQYLDIAFIPIELSSFANGEKRVWIKESIQGENIILVQSFSAPTDEHIMEFLLITDALERLGARHINAVIPWMGYSFQDKVFRDGEPIAAKVVADLVSNSYTKRAFLLDLHNSSVPGFFSIPTKNLTAMDMFVDYAKTNFENNVIVASPDFGGLKRSRQFADKLKVDLVNVDKHRDLSSGTVTAQSIQGGSVTGKTVLIFDDAILSGGTVVEVAKLLKQEGAAATHFFSTHAVFTPGAIEKMQDPAINSVIVTNSIAHQSLPEKIKIIDAAPLFAHTLKAWTSQ
jgi:ribose-phosphate pyrophosphokinase